MATASSFGQQPLKVAPRTSDIPTRSVSVPTQPLRDFSQCGKDAGAPHSSDNGFAMARRLPLHSAGGRHENPNVARGGSDVGGDTAGGR